VLLDHRQLHAVALHRFACPMNRRLPRCLVFGTIANATGDVGIVEVDPGGKFIRLINKGNKFGAIFRYLS